MRYKYCLLLFSLTVALTSCIAPSHKLPSVIFLDKPSIVPYNRYDFQLFKDIGVLVDGRFYVIPEGFETDLASIPRPLWSFISPRYSAFIAPAILHDYLYRCANVPSRRYADKVFYSALLDNHVTAFTAWKFFAAVRLFGWNSFDRGCIPYDD